MGIENTMRKIPHIRNPNHQHPMKLISRNFKPLSTIEDIHDISEGEFHSLQLELLRTMTTKDQNLPMIYSQGNYLLCTQAICFIA